MERSLQEELARKLEEKDKDLQAGLEKEKAKLEEVIANKEREYAELQTEVIFVLAPFLSALPDHCQKCVCDVRLS